MTTFCLQCTFRLCACFIVTVHCSEDQETKGKTGLRWIQYTSSKYNIYLYPHNEASINAPRVSYWSKTLGNLCYCYLVTKSCGTFWDPKDCSPPGSSVHRISQARIPEWIVIYLSRGSIFLIQPVSPALQVDSLPLSYQGSLSANLRLTFRRWWTIQRYFQSRATDRHGRVCEPQCTWLAYHFLIYYINIYWVPIMCLASWNLCFQVKKHPKVRMGILKF